MAQAWDPSVCTKIAVAGDGETIGDGLGEGGGGEGDGEAGAQPPVVSEPEQALGSPQESANVML